MRVGAFFGAADDAAANLQVAVRIFGIHDRECDAGAVAQGAGLDPSARCVDPNFAGGVIEPNRRYLGRTVLHHGSDIGESLLGSEQIEILVGDDCHCGIPPDIAARQEQGNPSAGWTVESSSDPAASGFRDSGEILPAGIPAGVIDTAKTPACNG